jgi:hypothetical protein
MDATYTVTFKGFAPKAAADLERWLEEDIAFFTKRVAMVSASVKKVEPSKKKRESHGKS